MKEKISILDYVNRIVKDLDKKYIAVREDDKKAVDELSRTTGDYRATHNDLLRKMEVERATFVTRRELWTAVIVMIGFMISILGIILSYYKK